MVTPVIIAGGSGSRLWPLSRSLQPKQFLTLFGEHSMLQETVVRLSGMEMSKPITICNEDHRFIVAEQLKEIGELGKIILEPVGRNTAPAIALAALSKLKDQDDVLLVLPADHLVKNRDAFIKAIKSAITMAEAGNLVTLGISPTEPHTGYGYIKRGGAEGEAYKVDAFVEKPDFETAQGYLSSGDYLWNSGMFLFKASVYLEELRQFNPEMVSVCEKAIEGGQPDLDFLRLSLADFEACPDDSVDYAVMEKTSKAVVVPMDAQWSDVGSWSSLWDCSDKDESGNVIRGRALTENVSDCLFYGDERLIAAVGVSDLVVVDTKDALLVAHKDEAQNVKKIVNALKDEGSTEYKLNREVLRPWGKYDSIDNGTRYQVKRITVKPGEKLSFQMHHHRAEHWIVVSGTAKVRRGEDSFLVSENESTYIPLGIKHSLENPGKIPLELIEVQSGSYLGEDDIVRFEDRYGRTSK